MKFNKCLIAVAVLGMSLSLVGSAHATIAEPQTYTYTFTASSGLATNLNGSTITIDSIGAGVSAFDFLFDGSSFSSTSPYTALEDSITSYDASGWDGNFDVSVDGQSFEAVGTGDPVDGVNGSLTVNSDPVGVWAGPLADTVPDSSSTAYLLLGGLGVMVGVYHRNRVLAKA
jgi:hypothetical protein